MEIFMLIMATFAIVSSIVNLFLLLNPTKKMGRKLTDVQAKNAMISKGRQMAARDYAMKAGNFKYKEAKNQNAEAKLTSVDFGNKKKFKTAKKSKFQKVALKETEAAYEGKTIDEDGNTVLIA